MIRTNGPVKKGAPAMPPPTATAATGSNGGMGPPPGMSFSTLLELAPCVLLHSVR